MKDTEIKVGPVDAHGGIVAVTVQLPESGRSFQATGIWQQQGNLHSETKLGVNWPSLGTLPLLDAEACARAIDLAGRKILEISLEQIRNG